MCGIVGFAGFRNDGLIKRMCDSLVHRGPDDNGFFCTERHTIAMQRLSILDLQSGHQPMMACENRVAIVFNGEIYNYREIRTELEKEGYKFRTNSDTEVILLGYVEWGLKVIERLIGMFAIAISDQRGNPVLYLIRDRFGVKPLYYYHGIGIFIFASEIKAILLHPSVSREINVHAIDQYLKLRYVPGEESLFKEIYKLPAASILEYSHGELVIEKYWSIQFPAQKLDISFEDAIQELRKYMETAIKRRLVADVPVGAYLSSGIDSSVIVALMSKFHEGPVNTFSVGFRNNQDETLFASETAKLLGTNHHEILCDDTDFEKLDDLVWHLDEPIGDAIVLPMYLLAREARKHVKVILAGEGADEVFGGYLFHKSLLAVGLYKKYLPSSLRFVARNLFHAVPHQIINRYFDYPAVLGSEGKKKLSGFLKQIEVNTIAEQYRNLISLFSDSELNLFYHPDFKKRLNGRKCYVSDNNHQSLTLLDEILAVQYRDWLPDDILMKLDKMTMANSLEGREPYLDHELVYFVNSLPDRYKIKGWVDKRILRSYAEELLPEDIARRKKMPFYIPIDKYFNKPTFRSLYESFHEENYLGGIFSSEFLKSLNLENTTLLHSKRLFSLIMLNRWFKIFTSSQRQSI